MEFYLIISTGIFIFSLYKKNKYLYFIVLIVLLLIASLRSYDVGTDTQTYAASYETIIYNPIFGFMTLEPGWVILNLLANQIFNDYRGVLFLSQCIILVLIFRRLWLSSPNPILGVLFYILLYFYLNSFNITRQVVAASIILYSYPFIIKGTKKSALLIIAAACFHYSSLVCLFLPLIYKIKLSKNSWIILLITSFIIGVVGSSYILSIIPAIGKYEYYLNNQISQGGFSLTRLLLNLLFIFILYSIRRNRYMVFCLFGVMIYNLMPSSPVIGRLASYFMLPELLIFSNYSCGNNRNYYIVKFVLTIYGFANLIIMLNANVSEVVPYKLL